MRQLMRHPELEVFLMGVEIQKDERDVLLRVQVLDGA